MRYAVLFLALAQWGDMPHLWAGAGAELIHDAPNARVFRMAGGNEDRLVEVLGCVLEEQIGDLKSMQCGEDFLFLGPAATVRLALARIANVQVEGYAQEARAFTATVGTVGAGRIDRGVIFSGSCYGAVAQCVMELGFGWEFRARAGSLVLVNPRGRVVDSWPK